MHCWMHLNLVISSLGNFGWGGVLSRHRYCWPMVYHLSCGRLIHIVLLPICKGSRIFRAIYLIFFKFLPYDANGFIMIIGIINPFRIMFKSFCCDILKTVINVLGYIQEHRTIKTHIDIPKYFERVFVDRPIIWFFNVCLAFRTNLWL